jgi:hypothetical protein
MSVIFVVDIDGTVCNSNERILEIIAKYGTEESWSQETIDDFLTEEKIMADEIIPGAEKLLDLATLCRASIIFLTGRNECARKLTRQWLFAKMGVTDSTPLLMRPLHRRNGHTADCKEEMFCSEVLSKNPDATFIFFEDDETTALKYSKYGLVLKSPKCWECIG